MSNSKPFTDMAARIDHNEGSTFGGACVIVPPKDAGKQIEVLMLDSEGDAAQFWSTISSRITIILEDLREQTQRARAMGMIR